MKHFNVECKKVFRVIGWPRSGQHGISNWLCSQFPGKNVFLNNIQSLPGHRYSFDEIAYVDGERALAQGKTNNVEALGLGFEGPVTRMLPKLPTVYVLRDLLNNVASLQKHSSLTVLDSFYDHWAQYLDKLYNCNGNEMCIDFSKWHIDKDYRQEVWNKFSELVGIKYELDDSKRNVILGSGGGSSFNEMNFNGRASEMDVLNRWKGISQFGWIPVDVMKRNTKEFEWVYDS